VVVVRIIIIIIIFNIISEKAKLRLQIFKIKKIHFALS
jgi:hypothetical protein